MTDFELNLRLRQEMESLAPNRLEELLAACGEQAPVKPNIEPLPRKTRRLPRLAAAAAAAVLVFSGSLFGVKAAQRSVVTVEAGPALCVTVNGFDRVRSVTIEGMETDADEFRGMKLKDAAEAFALQLMERDDIGSFANGVLVSVSDAGSRRTAALGEAVSEGIIRAASSEQFEPAVLLQRVAEESSGVAALTEAVAEFSRGIDLGTAESLSVQELLYVVDSQSLQWKDASFSGTLLNWRCASGADAEQIAADYAGAWADQYLTELSVYADQLAYSVRFSDGTSWRSFWVSAATGEILNPDTWHADPPQTQSTGQNAPTHHSNYDRGDIHDFFDFVDDLF